MKPPALSLGARLTLRRWQRNVYQSELADLLGVTTTTISNWERGNGTPSPEQLARITNYLGGDPL